MNESNVAPVKFKAGDLVLQPSHGGSNVRHFEFNVFLNTADLDGAKLAPPSRATQARSRYGEKAPVPGGVSTRGGEARGNPHNRTGSRTPTQGWMYEEEPPGGAGPYGSSARSQPVPVRSDGRTGGADRQPGGADHGDVHRNR
jgi:hypothetical protein